MSLISWAGRARGRRARRAEKMMRQLLIFLLFLFVQGDHHVLVEGS
jgi:hypothetical protein